MERTVKGLESPKSASAGSQLVPEVKRCARYIAVSFLAPPRIPPRGLTRLISPASSRTARSLCLGT
jgi:hypothetical protein